MRPSYTFLTLETRLDRLDQRAMLGISNRDFERLFGVNDVAAAGLLHFAKGHDCVISRGVTQIPNEGRRVRLAP